MSLEGSSLTVQPNQPSPSTLGQPSSEQKRSTEEHEPATDRQPWDRLTIEVTNFRPDTTNDTFARCFSNQVVCPCGGEVEEVDTSNQSSGIVYVKFTKPGGRCTEYNQGNSNTC